MTKAKKTKISMNDPRSTVKPVGPYVEPGRRVRVREDQIGADFVEPKVLRKAAAVLGKPGSKKGLVKSRTPQQVSGAAEKMRLKQLDKNKVKIFDLMTDYTLLKKMCLHGGRIDVYFIPDYKDHTDIIAERPGAAGARFEWLIPTSETGVPGSKDTHFLTVLSEDWEFDAVSDALKAMRAHIALAIETERQRNEVLRSLTPEQRKLIGKGDWRDPREDGEEEDGSTIPEED